MPSKFRVQFTVDKEIADKFTEKYPQQNPNMWAKQTFISHINGESCNVQPNNDTQIEKDTKKEKLIFLQKRNENYTYKNKIDKVKADHAEIFGRLPSRAADNAIKQRFESEKPQQAPQITNQDSNGQQTTFARPPEPIPNFEMESNGEGYRAKCNFCPETGATGWRRYEDAAIEDIGIHLQFVHNKPLYRRP